MTQRLREDRKFDLGAFQSAELVLVVEAPHEYLDVVGAVALAAETVESCSA